MLEQRETERNRATVQSVDRTLNILEALASRSGPAGISDLAEQVCLHVSTVHRLISTLVERGYVRQDPETSRYHLGSRIFALSTAADEHLDLRLVARPYLERMMRTAGETANLVTASENEVVYLDQVASSHLVKMFTVPGMRAPMYCTGVGKVIMAYRPAAAIEEVLSGPLERRTEQTLTTAKALRAELVRVRKLGYAIDNEEMEAGVRCLAVPVFDRRSEVVGALSVSGPTTRVTLELVERVASAVCAIAADLSKQLGYNLSRVPSSN